jgi:hypothetical protein
VGARGGAGRGQGRKPKPKVNGFASKDIAEQVLALKAPPKHEDGCMCELCGWWELLAAHDINIRGTNRRYLTDRKYGRAMQRAEDKIIFDPNQPLRVQIEHIGGSHNKAAAKAK